MSKRFKKKRKNASIPNPQYNRNLTANDNQAQVVNAYLKGRYDAARTTRENVKHWALADSLSADSALTEDVRKTLRNRARYEVGNNSYAKGTVLTLANDCIGTGPRLQLQKLGLFDSKTNNMIEQSFSDWCEAIDLPSKLLTMRMAKATDGEAFAIMITNPKVDHPIKLDIRLIEADRVTTEWFGGYCDPQNIDGVRLDVFGNPISYNVLTQHPGSIGLTFGKSVDVPATQSTQGVAQQQQGIQASGIAMPNLSLIAEQSVQAARNAVVAEQQRIQQIRTINTQGLNDLEAQAIQEGWAPDKFELEYLRAARLTLNLTLPGASGQVQIASVLEAAALGGSGAVPDSFLEKHYNEHVLEAAYKYRSCGLRQFVEMVCGHPLPNFSWDSKGWLQAAFSTASLPGILSNIANKSLLAGYDHVDSTWREVSKVGTINDFKVHSRYRLTSGFTFEKVGSDGELKHGKVGEQQFTQKGDTYGIMFALTRQMIINDDLSALSEIPYQIGVGAAEAISDAVWKCWLSNPTQADGKAFFSAEHNNYFAGANTALTVDGLSMAETKFMKQTKPDSKRPLGVIPKKLVVPIELKVAAELLMKSLMLNETTTVNQGKPAANPHVGKWDVVAPTYLPSRAFAGSSDKAWHLIADPYREGEPGLNPGVHKTEVGMDFVMINVLAFPVSGDEFELLFVFVPINFEGPAGLDAGQHGDEAFGDSVCGGDFSDEIFFSQGRRGDVLNRSVKSFGPLEESKEELFGHGLGVFSEVFEQTADTLKVRCHSEDVCQGSDVPAKDDSVPTGEGSLDLRFVIFV